MTSRHRKEIIQVLCRLIFDVIWISKTKTQGGAFRIMHQHLFFAYSQDAPMHLPVNALAL